MERDLRLARLVFTTAVTYDDGPLSATHVLQFFWGDACLKVVESGNMRW